MKLKLFQFINNQKIEKLIFLLIILNLVAVILESVKSIDQYANKLFNYFEIFSVSIFTIEYFLRIYTCNIEKKFKGFFGRFKFAFRPLNIIDLIVILPFYLSFLSIDTRFLRILRFIRVLRIFKAWRYSKALMVLGRVLYKSRDELLAVFAVLLVLLLVSASLLFFIENSYQPDSFSSIPASMWWSIATLTTVGYGDISPITPIGKLTGGIVSIIGLLMLAIPTGIIGAGFVEEYKKEKKD